MALSSRLLESWKEIKKAIKEWRKHDSISTKAKISSIMQQLQEIHSSMGSDSLNTEWQAKEKTKSELAHRLSLEEDQYGQKSREIASFWG